MLVVRRETPPAQKIIKQNSTMTSKKGAPNYVMLEFSARLIVSAVVEWCLENCRKSFKENHPILKKLRKNFLSL